MGKITTQSGSVSHSCTAWLKKRTRPGVLLSARSMCRAATAKTLALIERFINVPRIGLPNEAQFQRFRGTKKGGILSVQISACALPCETTPTHPSTAHAVQTSATLPACRPDQTAAHPPAALCSHHPGAE
jgi:hypothetical protein